MNGIVNIVKIVMTDVYRIKYVFKKILNFEIHEFSFFLNINFEPNILSFPQQFEPLPK